MNRRAFLGLGGAAVLGLGLYGSEFERHDLQVEEHTVRLRGLADSFHGMRIAQISDLHYDEYTEPYFIREVVARVNALRPDVVLITGDFVSYGPLSRRFGARHANPCAALLQNLECPLRFAVMGNHDAEVGEAIVTDALTTHGIPVLENRYVPLERDGRRLWIGGVGDVMHRKVLLESAVPPRPLRGNDPVVLMAHEPDFANRVARYGGVDLMLSGHSHGGQVRLPLVGPLILPPMGKKYVQGFFQVGAMTLYVNRGIGTVGIPVRCWCRPEITMFTLSAGG
jgi:hypothetical protein